MEMVYEKNEKHLVSNNEEAANGVLILSKGPTIGNQHVSRLQMNERDLIRSNIIKTSIVLG